MYWADIMCVLFLAIENVFSNDYCQLSVCGTQQHTMCKYPTNEPGPDCQDFDVDQRKFTNEEKKLIVNGHNTYRNRIAMGREEGSKGGRLHSSSDMMELIWDDELAAIAERWTAQCKNGHDECRALLNGESSGQNVALGEFDTRETDLTAYMEGWFKEVEHYDASERGPFNQKMNNISSRFTQIIWSRTNRVGCGQAWFKVSTFAKKAHMLVCNYAPSGNTLGGTVYLWGQPCYSCPSGNYRCSTTWKALCPNNKQSLSMAEDNKSGNTANVHRALDENSLFQDTYKSNPDAYEIHGKKGSGASRTFDAGILLKSLTLALILAVFSSNS